MYFLRSRGILHAERICLYGHAMSLRMQRYRWKDCRTENGLRVGTWLADTRLPLRSIIIFLYVWAYQKASTKFVNDTIGMKLSYSGVRPYGNSLPRSSQDAHTSVKSVTLWKLMNRCQEKKTLRQTASCPMGFWSQLARNPGNFPNPCSGQDSCCNKG